MPEYWEILPYSEEAEDYFLWLEDHEKFGLRIKLSNAMDACEYIQFDDQQQIDELISRLERAKHELPEK